MVLLYRSPIPVGRRCNFHFLKGFLTAFPRVEEGGRGRHPVAHSLKNVPPSHSVTPFPLSLCPQSPPLSPHFPVFTIFSNVSVLLVVGWGVGGGWRKCGSFTFSSAGREFRKRIVLGNTAYVQEDGSHGVCHSRKKVRTSKKFIFKLCRILQLLYSMYLF
jgi:hypothetical protein